MSEEKTDPDTDWFIECSDDEKYDPTKQAKGVWEPNPEDIISLYNQLSRGETLPLEWKACGRRSPTPERKVEEMETETVIEEQDKPEEKSIVTVTEFEFNEDFGGTNSNPVTPRRTPGSTKTPRTQKRVARLDKIMDDIRRHKKINEQANRAAPSKPRTPPVGDRGMPRTRTPPVVDGTPRTRTPPVVDGTPRTRTPPVVDGTPRTRTPPVVDGTPRTRTPPVVDGTPRTRTPPVVDAMPRTRTPPVADGMPSVVDGTSRIPPSVDSIPQRPKSASSPKKLS